MDYQSEIINLESLLTTSEANIAFFEAAGATVEISLSP